MSFQADYQNVATYLSKQVAENQSTVKRLKNEIQVLKRNHENFLEGAKLKFGECRALDLETSGILTSLRKIWKQINSDDEMSVEGRRGCSQIGVTTASVITSTTEETDLGTVSSSTQDVVACGSSIGGSASVARDCPVVVKEDSSVNDLTTYLNTMCGRKKHLQFPEAEAKRADKKPAATPAKNQDQDHNFTLSEESDPFERLLRENEMLANDLKTKKKTIEILAQKLADCSVSPSTQLNYGSEVGSTAWLACPCKNAGDDAQVTTIKVKKKIRYLLTKLEAKVKENQALVQKIEMYKGTDEEYAKLVEENRHLKDRLNSSLRHRNNLEAEIQKGYHTIKQHEEEKRRLQEKVRSLERSMQHGSTRSLPRTPSAGASARSVSTPSLATVSPPATIWSRGLLLPETDC